MSFLLGFNRRDFWLIVITVLVVLLAIPTGTVIATSQDSLSRETVMNKNNGGVILLDRHGTPFFQFYQAKYQTTVLLDQISPAVKQAVVAAEDKDFYSHPGFSLKGIARSLIIDFQQKDLLYGGSTLTQQLVKNSLLSSDKTLLRKYRELVLSQELEKRYTKDEILEMYLNSVYFGEGAFGIEDAAKTYFNSSANNLSLSQAALLVGILKAPSHLSPITGNRDEAIQRQRYVLDQMVSQNFITPIQAQEAANTTLNFASPKPQFTYQAPHFALMVKQELIDLYGEEALAHSGFKVYTSLDLDWQKYAEQQVQLQVSALANNNVTNAATVVLDAKNSHIRALVGSVSWSQPDFGQLNMATTPRQPGSTFKPIIYSAAFEKGLITPATILMDKPTTFANNYTPKNYDLTFRGPVLARRALANSLNVPSVQVLSKLGVNNALEIAQRLGITTLNDPNRFGLSLVLGTGEVPLLEMTNVYATFANNGYRNNPTILEKIEDKFGQTIYNDTPKPIQVLPANVTFLISSILSDSAARREEFGNLLDTKQQAAVKTGTSEDYKDSWTIGYTPDIVVGVWVGNPYNQPMSRIAGSIGAAPIWKAEIDRFSSPKTTANFIPPTGITSLSVCRFNSLPTKEATSSTINEYFITGSEPTGNCVIPKPTSPPETNRS